MTTETPPEVPVDETTVWRGLAKVDADEAAERMTAGTLGGGSKRLLRELLTPYKRAIWILVVVVVVENAARLAIPYLVKEGIDTGIPPIAADDNLEPLFFIVGLMLVATLTQAVARQLFLVRSGKIGQDVLFQLRGRVFRHFQVLSPAFHDGYTSGRVISRQTSDVDAIYEMLETGFDGLVTAALTLVGTAGLLLFLDVKLGLVALTCGPFLAWLTLWFRRESGEVLQGHPREGRARHRPLRRVDGRDPRGPGVPPRAAQPGDLRRRQRPVPPRQPRRLPAGRVVHARHPADRQRHDRHRAALRRLPRLPRRRHRRRARGVPALPAPVLRADDGDLAVLQHLPVRLGGAGQAGRCPRGGAVGARAHRPGRAERRRRR